MSNSDYAQHQLGSVSSRILTACLACGREIDEVTLIGASKKQSPERIKSFLDAGLANLGENYLQEAIDKQSALEGANVQWHFIGQIQSNKTKLIAQHFNWIHGVDRLKIAARLGSQRLDKRSINLLVQLNPDQEQSKGGVSLRDAPELCGQIAQIENVNLRGFMMIPKARESATEQRAVFAQARELMSQTNQRHGIKMDHLSMGMSGDLESAIAEGSTMVRIGTDLFGARR